MKLILEAIKAMFRKVSTGISKLSGRVDELEKRVPRPGTKDQKKFLRGDGTWGTFGMAVIRTEHKGIPVPEDVTWYSSVVYVPPGTYKTLKDAVVSGNAVALFEVYKCVPENYGMGVRPLSYVYVPSKKNPLGTYGAIGVFASTQRDGGIAKNDPDYYIIPNDTTVNRHDMPD